MERVFLGWDRPLLHAVRDWLYARARAAPQRLGEAEDFSAFTIILPGARAGRRFLELLTADARAGVVVPPRVMTLGAWTMLGARSGTMTATPAARLAAWLTALRSLSVDQRRAVASVTEGDDAGGPAWIGVARLIDACHAELCAEAIRFEDVLRRAPAADGFTDSGRWEALAAAQRHYERALRGAGFTDAGLAAVHGVQNADVDVSALTGDVGAAGSAAGLVAVAGLSEMGALSRRTIDAAVGRCVALVPAPGDLADRFDDYGCVIPAKWQNVRIDVPEAAVIAAEGPEEQAAAVLRVIERIGRGAGPSGAPADAVTIGAPDPEVEDRVRRLAGRLTNVPVRSAEGTRVHFTRPVKLLLAVAQYVEDRDFRAFAALVRHSDVENWIVAQHRRKNGQLQRALWLPILDAYQTEHLHGEIDGTWLTKDETQPAEETNEQRVLDLLYKALTDLLGKGAGGVSLLDGARREPSFWCARVWDVIRGVYSGRAGGSAGRRRAPEPAAPTLFDDLAHSTSGAASTGSVDETTREACLALQAHLAELASLPPDLASSVRLSAAEFIRFLVLMASEDAIPEPGDSPAIDLVGWLELPADDAPWVVVAGMNEGVVPAAPGADPLIPESLRRALGLRDRASRHARDSFAMLRITQSRRAGDAVFIFGRRSGAGDPLAPSRLLLAGDDASLRERVRAWTAAGPHEAASHMLTPGPKSGFEVSPAALSRVVVRPVEVMSVTAFRSYIRSPLGFYLQYVLGLKEIDDAGVELDAMAFGNLVHDVVCKLVDPELSACTDAGRISDFLSSSLEGAANMRFGADPRAELWLQLEQARTRLQVFAVKQAERAAQGWRIVRTEWAPAEGAAFLMVDGVPMHLRGRIDRIDVNIESGKWAVLDYKTGNKKPEMNTARTAKGVWLDPQLPLYRRLVQPLMSELGVSGEPILGWVALPNKSEDIDFIAAEWGPAELSAADDTAADIVRKVRAGMFDAAGDNPPGYGAFAWLCGSLEREEVDE